MTGAGWTFDVDAALWLPVPRAGTLDTESREQWLDAAMARAAGGATRAYCAALLAEAPAGGACLYFPAPGAPPRTAAITFTDGDDAAAAAARLSSRNGARSVQTETLEHPALADMRRVTRVRLGPEGLAALEITLLAWDDHAGAVIALSTSDLGVAGRFASDAEALLRGLTPPHMASADESVPDSADGLDRLGTEPGPEVPDVDVEDVLLRG